MVRATRSSVVLFTLVYLCAFNKMHGGWLQRLGTAEGTVSPFPPQLNILPVYHRPFVFCVGVFYLLSTVSVFEHDTQVKTFSLCFKIGHYQLS